MFSDQDDAEHMLRLKGEVDVIGGQKWDGKANTHIYPNALMFSTAQNKVFYAYTDTATEQEKWIRAIQLTVATTVPNSLSTNDISIGGCVDIISPINSIPMSENSEGPNSLATCSICNLNEEVVVDSPSFHNPATTKHKCHSCEFYFCEKHSTNEVPLPIKDYYYAKRVCDECYRSQCFLNYLKTIVERLKAGICLYPKPLNADVPIELIMPNRPSHTPASNIALDLFKDGCITAEELETLLNADKRYLDQTVEHPEIPLDLEILALHREFKMADFSVSRCIVLLHQSLEKDPLCFKPIVEKMLQFSFTAIDEVEFYWPQLVHAYLRLPMFDIEKLFWMDELILSICSRSIHLALLLIWNLQGSLEDAVNNSLSSYPVKEMEDKYARIVRLMVEIQVEVVGKKRNEILRTYTSNATISCKNMFQIDYILPKPTEDQLLQIEKFSYILATFREMSKLKCEGDNAIDANAIRNQEQTVSQQNSCNGIIKDSSSTGVSTSIQYRDFSKFQQHLLTPSSCIEGVEALEIVDTTSEGSLEEVNTLPKKRMSYSDAVTSTLPELKMKKCGSGIRERTLSQDEKFLLATYFTDECDFVSQIANIAEQLRFVQPVSDRNVHLPQHLKKLFVPEMAYIPLVKASNPFERILRIPPNEATAFSTKARVPIMLIFEVLRGGENEVQQQMQQNQQLEGENGEGVENEEEKKEEDLVDQLILQQSEQQQFHQQSTQEMNSGSTTEKESVSDSVKNILSVSFVESSAPITPTVFSTPVETPIAQGGLLSGGNSGKIVFESDNEDEEVEIVDDKKEVLDSISTPHKAADALRGLVHSNHACIAKKEEEDRIRGDLMVDVKELSEETMEREENRKKDLEAAFGESWDSKRSRLKSLSPFGHLPGWDIVSMIGKSNDDVRQEVFTLQVIQKFVDIFAANHVAVFLKCYRIIATGSSCGLIETLANAISLDGLKKREGYVNLRTHFEKSYGPITQPEFQTAKRNFIQSMAGYSLVSYFLQIKDRHNGNIMLDNEGHIVHIDYGFLLGIAPGGSFSIETAPFKLTAEMVDVMGGDESEGFKEYMKLCTVGFLAAQKYADELCDLVEIMAQQSPYPCFYQKDVGYILSKFRNRFKAHYTKEQTVAHVLNLIRKANSNYSTRQYDNFQRMTNGILP